MNLKTIGKITIVNHKVRNIKKRKLNIITTNNGLLLVTKEILRYLQEKRKEKV